MTVYEMIQELSQYDADQEVEINVVANGLEVNAVVNEDIDKGCETEVEVDFDETVSDFEIDERRSYTKNAFRINVDLD